MFDKEYGGKCDNLKYIVLSKYRSDGVDVYGGYMSMLEDLLSRQFRRKHAKVQVRSEQNFFYLQHYNPSKWLIFQKMLILIMNYVLFIVNLWYIEFIQQ